MILKNDTVVDKKNTTINKPDCKYDFETIHTTIRKHPKTKRTRVHAVVLSLQLISRLNRPHRRDTVYKLTSHSSRHRLSDAVPP